MINLLFMAQVSDKLIFIGIPLNIIFVNWY